MKHCASPTQLTLMIWIELRKKKQCLLCKPKRVISLLEHKYKTKKIDRIFTHFQIKHFDCVCGRIKIIVSSINMHNNLKNPCLCYLQHNSLLILTHYLIKGFLSIGLSGTVHRLFYIDKKYPIGISFTNYTWPSF